MAKDPGLVNGLAGMEPTPTPNAVHAAHGGYRATVEHSGSAVTVQGQGCREQATSAGASAGVATDSAITSRFGNTIADTVSNQNNHSGAVNIGAKQVEQEGAEQRSAVRISVDPNRSLLGDAMDKAADTVGGWGRDALNTLVEALPGDHAPRKADDARGSTEPVER
jgi:hypothetical protein